MDGLHTDMGRPDAAQIAGFLEALESQAFGGKPNGRFRISRKFLRQFADRRRLPADLLADIADEMFERGYVLIDMETYFVVIPQRYFGSYRRVTAAAMANALPGAVADVGDDAALDD